MSASLTYYIWEGVLVGRANGVFFQLFAASGGGGASTRNPPALSANNPYEVGLQTHGKATQKLHVHGGPIPPGPYRVARPTVHPLVRLSARLTPTGGQPMFGRSGFLIHGPGPHGSDGCIVLEDRRQLAPLLAALDASGGGTLHVEEAMYGQRFA
jgi:hypothetical protein